MIRIIKYLYLLLLFGLCEAANILYLIPYAEKSHYISLRPIGLELARRGHNVTVVTTFKEVDHPANYHQVMVDQAAADEKTVFGETDGQRPNLFTTVDMTTADLLHKFLWIGGWSLTDKYLSSSNFKKFLAEEHEFDLVISEQFAQEALHTLAHKYNAPLVLVSTFGNVMKQNMLTRNPLQLATVVFDWADIEKPTSFWGRLKNLYMSLYEYIWWRFWYLKEQDRLVMKYIKDLPEPVPSLVDLQRNAVLTLVNSHFSFDPPTAYLPNIVEIGGAHLDYDEKSAELPHDLKEILDNAKHGVIYVSLGSNVRSSELPSEKKNAFLEVFGKLKQTVLWKWEDDTLGAATEKIITRKWFPQKEILGHPNVKLFISHGGLIGTQEATYNGVPIIGIPIFADQYNNLLRAQELGFGRVLRYHDIEKNLERILQEVLNEDSYKNKAKEVSIRFRDRPLNALDTAMFWIEYVIRNNGATYMKNPALDLSWLAYNMFDVYAFILAILFVTMFIILKLVSYVASILTLNTESNKKKVSKKIKKR